MSLSEKCAAFERLYLRARPRVFNLVSRSLHSPDDAEDITQAAFAKAWASFDWYNHARSFESWVSRIAMNLVIDDYRRRIRWRTYSLNQIQEQKYVEGRLCAPEMRDHAPTPEERALANTISVSLLTALHDLPDEQSRCLLLAGQDLPYDQIAVLLDCPIGTVRSRVSRARARIRRALQTCPEWVGR